MHRASMTSVSRGQRQLDERASGMPYLIFKKDDDRPTTLECGKKDLRPLLGSQDGMEGAVFGKVAGEEIGMSEQYLLL